MEVKEQVDAKAKLGREKALELLGLAQTVYISKGRKSLEFSMSEEPDEEELLALMLGRTGNLRAPTLLRGDTLLVGFNTALYESFFDA